MLVISETEERTTTTPNAAMASLATPSAGSTELASWRVRMAAGAAGPEHVIDREPFDLGQLPLMRGVHRFFAVALARHRQPDRRPVLLHDPDLVR